SSSSSNCLGFSGSKSFSIIKDLNLLLRPRLDFALFTSMEFSKHLLDVENNQVDMKMINKDIPMTK
ncbi:MAG: hypothetical protein VW864_05630, partial [Flavobacteriaceae bacterium]